MIRRIFGPDPLYVRLRLLAAETVGAAGIALSLYVSGRMAKK